LNQTIVDQYGNSCCGKMAELDKRIADLEEVIKAYEVKLNAATTEKELALFAGLINSARETLIRLLDEKKARTVGAKLRDGIPLLQNLTLSLPSVPCEKDHA
jgi:hypothetical protein